MTNLESIKTLAALLRREWARLFFTFTTFTLATAYALAARATQAVRADTDPCLCRLLPPLLIGLALFSAAVFGVGCWRLHREHQAKLKTPETPL